MVCWVAWPPCSQTKDAQGTIVGDGVEVGASVGGGGELPLMDVDEGGGSQPGGAVDGWGEVIGGSGGFVKGASGVDAGGVAPEEDVGPSVDGSWVLDEPSVTDELEGCDVEEEEEGVVSSEVDGCGPVQFGNVSVASIHSSQSAPLKASGHMSHVGPDQRFLHVHLQPMAALPRTLVALPLQFAVKEHCLKQLGNSSKPSRQASHFAAGS